MRSIAAFVLCLPLIASAQEAAVPDDVPRAKAAIQKALDADPNNAQLWIHMGFIDHKLGDLDGAQAAFEKVVSLRATETSAHYMLALIYEKKNLTDKAVASWKACL